MSTRTVFLTRLIGLFLIAMAAAMAFNKEPMVQTITTIVHEPELLLTWGMITLAAGLAMVIVHNVWSGGPAPVLVTVIGWGLLLKSVILLCMPPIAMIGLYRIVRFEDVYFGYVAVVALLGAFLTYVGFTAAVPVTGSARPPL